MTLRARSDIGGNARPAKAGDPDGADVVIGEPTDRAEAEDVTAPVTPGAHSASNTPTIADFLSAVVPWPKSTEEPGYINLQYSYVDSKSADGKRAGKWPVSYGWPFKTLNELVSRSAWANGQDMKFKDQWYCLSLQSSVKTDPHKPGKVKAMRLAANAMAVKAIWVDIDVKDGGYATLNDALKAITQFQRDAGMPPLSALVSSGSGLHAYWISDVALSPAEWAPYAHGLKSLLLQRGVKCDAGLTTDIARILRVPGTFNHKTSPPKPVQLLGMPLVCYSFPDKLGFLTQIASGNIHRAKAPTSLFADGADMAAFKAGPDAAFAALPKDEKLAEKLDDIPLPIAPIFKDCGMYREALRTGGADHDQPLWNLAVLGTTFMENGNAVAHEISKGHSTYSPADTQALYDRKVAERANRGIGYPSCAAIAGAGSSACTTCPLLSKGKSPLNIRTAVTATVTDGPPPCGSTGQAKWTRPAGVSFANIPHRKWLYGHDLVRGELTVIGSPGGAGKSSLAIGMAICLATNRELLGEKIRGGSHLKALVVNGEDSTDEIRRRTNAFCLAHGIPEQDLHGLTVVGANDHWVQSLSFLTTNDKGLSALNSVGFDALRRALDTLRPDVVVIDPLVSFCAGGNMNDNAAMSSVMRELKAIAANYECAILIVHHTRKGGDAGNVEAISGAAAITNLARRAIMPVPLTDAEAMRLGILPSERLQYFKLVDAKSNLVPRAADSPLYRLHSVELPNAEPPLYPFGDNVQAITRFEPAVQPSGSGQNAGDMKIEAAIRELVDRGKEIDGQTYPYSPGLAGARNERAFLPDAMVAVANATAPRQWLPGDLEAVIKAALNKMQADGRIVIEDMKDLMPKPGRFRRGRGLKAVPI